MPGPALGQNYSMPRGDSRILRMTVRDDDGNPVSLPGASARYWVARRSGGVGVLLEKDSGDGLNIEVSGLLYTLVVMFDPEDTEDLAPGHYYHEAEVIDADDNVATVMVGQFTLTPAIIRPA